MEARNAESGMARFSSSVVCSSTSPQKKRPPLPWPPKRRLGCFNLHACGIEVGAFTPRSSTKLTLLCNRCVCTCPAQDVRMLRSRQFPEDAGPLAHPIRPESYIVMDNFYTATVYVKGAEVSQPPAPRDARHSSPVGCSGVRMLLSACLSTGLPCCVGRSAMLCLSSDAEFASARTQQR